MRAKDSKLARHREKVPFINADAEFREGRTQCFLKHEHIERIMSVYTDFKDVSGFATVVSRERLRDEGCISTSGGTRSVASRTATCVNARVREGCALVKKLLASKAGGDKP